MGGGTSSGGWDQGSGVLTLDVIGILFKLIGGGLFGFMVYWMIFDVINARKRPCLPGD